MGHEGNPAAGPRNAWRWVCPFPPPEPWLQHPNTLLGRLLGCQWWDPAPLTPSLSEVLALAVAGDGWRGQPELGPLGSRASDEPPIPPAGFGGETASKSSRCASPMCCAPPGCPGPQCSLWGAIRGSAETPPWEQNTTIGADPAAHRCWAGSLAGVLTKQFPWKQARFRLRRLAIYLFISFAGAPPSRGLLFSRLGAAGGVGRKTRVGEGE